MVPDLWDLYGMMVICVKIETNTQTERTIRTWDLSLEIMTRRFFFILELFNNDLTKFKIRTSLHEPYVSFNLNSRITEYGSNPPVSLTDDTTRRSLWVSVNTDQTSLMESYVSISLGIPNVLCLFRRIPPYIRPDGPRVWRIKWVSWFLELKEHII